MGREGVTESPLPNTFTSPAQGGSVSERWGGSILERCQHDTQIETLNVLIGLPEDTILRFPDTRTKLQKLRPHGLDEKLLQQMPSIEDFQALIRTRWEVIVVNNGRVPVVLVEYTLWFTLTPKTVPTFIGGLLVGITDPTAGKPVSLPISLLPGQVQTLSLDVRMPISVNAKEKIRAQWGKKAVSISKVQKLLLQDGTDLFGNDLTAGSGLPNNRVLRLALFSSRGGKFMESASWYPITGIPITGLVGVPLKELDNR